MTQGVHTAVVAGGGLAGVAAALELSRQGVQVTLYERRSSLGGRASSFRDPVSGRVVDNGQHVILGACEELKSLLTELGTASQVGWSDSFELWCPVENSATGTLASLRPARWLPGKLRFLPALLRLPFLTPGERWAAVRGLTRAALLREDELAALDAITFDAWLQRERQPPRVIARLWAPIVVSALNETPDRASARAALWIFRRGFLGRAADSALGIPKVPLGSLLGDAALTRLQERGVQVRFGAEVSRVDMESGRAAGVTVDGASVRADITILATPWDSLSKLLPESLLTEDPRLRAAAAAEPSPIVSAHFFFGPAAAVKSGALALVESRAQWVFDRHAATGLDDDRGHLVVVVSAARELAHLTREQIADALLGDLKKILPSLAGETPRRVLVLTEWKATYSSAPHFEASRPGVRSPIAGLYFASDVCDVGWPPTMEGAVLAGRRAARAALEDGPQLEVPPDSAYPPTTHG